MFRIILILLLIYLIYSLWKRLRSRKAKTTSRRSGDSLPPGEMIPCDKCQTFVLRSDAMEKKGKYYCSKGCIL